MSALKYFKELFQPVNNRSRFVSAMVIRSGSGTVLGSVKVPIDNADCASFSRADCAGAKLVAFAAAGADTVYLIKQSAEFGLKQGGRGFAALLTGTSDVARPFYWDLDDASRRRSARFSERQHGESPTAFHAGVYSPLRGCLRAARAAGCYDPPAVVRSKEQPIDDDRFAAVVVRQDGRALYSVHIRKTKSPDDFKGKWDLLDQVRVLTAVEAIAPLDGSGRAQIQ